MTAYVLVDITVVKTDSFMEYVGRIPALIKKYGGRYLVRGEPPEVLLATSETPQVIVLLEFPSRVAASGFFAERDALGLSELFRDSTRSRILVADGVDEAQSD